MSMILRKIEVWNIRCHEHFIFQPDLTGITAISGKNGSGKSTIVDAFAWALYGTKANKVKNKMLIREGVDPNKERVAATVYIVMNKIEYKIERKILSDSGATDCNVYGRTVNSNALFTQLAGPAISSAEAYIRQILKMDEKGFLTSILIQQKQVDQIVSASPKERGEVIEKLTGISSISNAIRIANDKAKTFQKAANLITPEDLPTIIAEAKNRVKETKQLEEVINRHSEEGIGQRNLVEQLTSKVNEETKKYEEANEIKESININKAQIKILSAELDNNIKIVKAYKKNNNSTIISDPKELEKKYMDIVNTINSYNNKISNLNNTINNLNNENSSILELLSNNNFTLSEDNKDKIKDTLTSELSKVTADRETLSKTINDNTSDTQMLLAEEKQSNKALKTIDTGLHECPVCKRPIDNPAELQNEIKNEIKKIKVQIKDKKQLIKDDTEQLNLLDEKINLLNTLLNDKLSIYASNLISISKANEEKQQYEEKLIDLKVKGNVANKVYKEALNAQSNKQALDNAKKRVLELDKKVSDIYVLNKNIESKLNSLQYLSKSELNALQRELNDKTKGLNNKIIEVRTEKERYNYLRQQVNDLKEKYTKAVDANKKYTQIMTNLQIATVAASLMSQFKSNRIKYSIPTLEMYASTILVKFTDGKFSKLKLDEKFKTSVVTSDGHERPINQLSGGELSAAAIALRLGISMLLNGNERNVLIFDEVLVSMDEVRARQIIETISSITNCQVIFIAHNSDINTVADTIVKVG